MPVSSRSSDSDTRLSIWPRWHGDRAFALLLGILMAYLIVFTGAKIRETMFSSNHIGYGDQMAPTLSVNATGTAYLESDIATVDLGVTNNAPTAAVAQSDNTAKMNAVIAALRELGIDEVDMKTSAYNVYPQYDYNQSPAVITGYEASQTLTVKIRNRDSVGAILERVGTAGANTISSLRYEADDQTVAEAEARAEAIAQAYEQALKIADTMGAKVGRVVSYSEVNNANSGYYPYAYDVRAESAAPDIQPGQEEVSMTVYLVYSLE